MRALELITGYVILKLPYDEIYQLKTTMDQKIKIAMKILKTRSVLCPLPFL